MQAVTYYKHRTALIRRRTRLGILVKTNVGFDFDLATDSELLEIHEQGGFKILIACPSA